MLFNALKCFLLLSYALKIATFVFVRKVSSMRHRDTKLTGRTGEPRARVALGRPVKGTGTASGRAREHSGVNTRYGLAVPFLLFLVVGCDGLDLQYLPDQVQPVPTADIPEQLRVDNWIGTSDDGSSGGSCVHASTINTFRAIYRPDLEAKWLENRDRGYEGPETGYGIIRKFQEQRIPHAVTSDGDSNLLDEASRTNRPGVIFYYPSHSITFIEFAMIEGREFAVLLDNNFTERYIVVSREVFEKSWRYYGGFALIPWVEPTVPRTFPRAIPKG